MCCAVKLQRGHAPQDMPDVNDLKEDDQRDLDGDTAEPEGDAEEDSFLDKGENDDTGDDEACPGEDEGEEEEQGQDDEPVVQACHLLVR